MSKRTPPPSKAQSKGKRIEPAKKPKFDDSVAGVAESAWQSDQSELDDVAAEARAASHLVDDAAMALADTGQPDTAQVNQAEPREPKVFHAPVSPYLPPFEILDDYERRSLAHVVGLPEQLDAPGLWRGVGYRIGDKRLASGFDEVVEIMSMPQVTPVPGSQPWLLGVANIRGNLLPIVDLKQFLEGERTVLHESQRVLIVRQPGGDVAVTIDELFGQRSFNESQQQTPETLAESPLAQGRYTHFIDRAYRLADDSWGIFSLERLSRTPEFRQAAA